MLEQFLAFIKKNKLFDPKEPILLAVSGGMDSVIMAELFHQAKFRFAIAHCNFQLRGKESDGDEKFVKELAGKSGVEFFTTRFDTEQETKQHKVSIQMAARKLRYQWFEQILNDGVYEYVATAHHLSDSVETFFINLLRGTGIEGITGIEAKGSYVVRPLLFARREQIEKFAKENKIKYREDSSNNTDDYLRNRIRHHLIPVFKSLSQNFEESMSANMSHFTFAAKLFSHQVKERSEKLLEKGQDLFSISISELKKQEYADQLLYELLHPYGFNFIQCEEMLNEDILTKSGKIFLAHHFRAVRDRDKIVLDTIDQKDDHEFLIPKTKKKTVTDCLELKTSFTGKEESMSFPAAETEQWLDADLLRFPLKLRKWEAGDFFYPLGMKHRKKLSDFFIDQKLNLFVKENICVLTSENEIVCILGHRIDNRFKVTDKTKKIYKVEMRYL